jgi:riboflavin synthase
LTVRRLLDDAFVATISEETASRTTIGRLRTGTRVNLELPLTPQSGLDGHWVLGHVDTVGRIQALFRERTGWSLIVSHPGSYSRYVVNKGSVTIDGISLTSFAAEPGSFRCAVIPETYEQTTLQDRRSGDPVNLEFDILGKYVERMMRNVHHD